MRPLALSAVVAGVVLGVARTAGAAPPDAQLLERLSRCEQDLESAARRLSFRAEEIVQKVDGDGKVSSTKTTRYRVESDGKTTPHKIVERSVEDGKDVTADEQEKARSKEAERASKKPDADKPVWPFAPGSQAQYAYDQVRVDPAHPAYVEIAFVPRHPDSHTFEGKAWVDADGGRILSASVRLSKPPALVDWVHLTAQFDPTPAGLALSHLTFEGAGGILFFRKHFRGEIKMSDWRLAP